MEESWSWRWTLTRSAAALSARVRAALGCFPFSRQMVPVKRETTGHSGHGSFRIWMRRSAPGVEWLGDWKVMLLYVGQILSRWMRMNLGGGLGRHGGRALIS
ncbi:hypothetical protein B0H13DRAFT_2655279 [Mycena leptocephala]|nr:hypothetical protein B0H13DRAFT_2655279 [Mycena leptocephala]